jgi:hypothetical protein
VSGSADYCQLQKMSVDAVGDIAREQKKVCFHVVSSIVDSNF